MPENTPRPVAADTVALWLAHTPVEVRLSWHPTEPLMATLTFHPHRGAVEWLVSREMLATGLLVAGGDMDVRIEPFLGDVLVTLDNHHEEQEPAPFLFRGEALAAFLADTYRQVPLGSEQVTVPDPAFFADTPGGRYA